MLRDVLRPSDLLTAAQSSFSYYSILPSDGPALADDWPKFELKSIARRIESSDSIEIGNVGVIDELTLALLGHGARPLPEGPNWKALARRLSLLYARNLKTDGIRHVRMKAARANYFLRDLIDIGDAGEILDERRFAQGFVWDWQPWQCGEVIADSSDENVSYCQPNGNRQAFRLGLPTQIDRLGEDRLAVTSCYSDGWHVFNPGAAPEFHQHGRPVVLAFCHGDDTFFLDQDGVLYRIGHLSPVLKVPVSVGGTVGRARFLHGVLFVSDWSDPECLTVIEMNGLRIFRWECMPVLLVNDICILNDVFYIVDKMQGRVFSFNSDFSSRSERLSFGKARGRLYDPIAIKHHNGKLFTLSWLTGALSTIDPF